ncbi:MAG: HAD family hydrolase [Microgenomates group bacterium]
MDERFSVVKVLVWDIDGTLYPPHKELFHMIRESEYKTIMHHTGWDKEKAMEEFAKLHKKTIQSATEVVAVLSGRTIAEVAVESETYFDRRDFILKDERLPQLFTKLSSYTHVTLGNGSLVKQKETLVYLGLDLSLFSLFVTAETVGFTKPNPAGFQYVLAHTGFPPEAHMMIGDREKVDLVPAHTLGMKTCLIGEAPSDTIADLVIPTLYDIERSLV